MELSLGVGEIMAAILFIANALAIPWIKAKNKQGDRHELAISKLQQQLEFNTKEDLEFKQTFNTMLEEIRKEYREIKERLDKIQLALAKKQIDI